MDPYHRCRFVIEALVSTFPKASVYVYKLPNTESQPTPQGPTWKVSATFRGRSFNDDRTWTINAQGQCSPKLNADTKFEVRFYRAASNTPQELTSTFRREEDIIGFLGMLRSRYLPGKNDHQRIPTVGNEGPMPSAAQWAYQRGFQPGRTPSETDFDLAAPDDYVSNRVFVTFRQPGRPEATIRIQSKGQWIVAHPDEATRLRPVIEAKAQSLLAPAPADLGNSIVFVGPRTYQKLLTQQASMSVGHKVKPNSLGLSPLSGVQLRVCPTVPEGQVYAMPKSETMFSLVHAPEFPQGTRLTPAGFRQEYLGKPWPNDDDDQAP